MCKIAWGLLVLGAANISFAAPVTWSTASGGNGHSYEVFAVPGGITWGAAQAAATSKGGYLATITSAAENAFAYALANQDIYWTAPNGIDLAGPWLGGFQPPGSPEPAGNYQWVTGEPFSYTNWYPGLPNDNQFFGGEDRVHFYGAGRTVAGRTAMWNDAFHDDTHIAAYVVEFDPPPAPAPLPPAVMVVPLVGAGIILRARRQAKL